MTRKILKSIVLPGVVLLAAACAQQGQQQESSPATESAPAATESVPMGMPMELTPEKINEMAAVAVAIANDPSVTGEILAKHGMTQDMWNEAMRRISADPALQSAFDQAKAAAESGETMMEGAGETTEEAGETTEEAGEAATEAAGH